MNRLRHPPTSDIWNGEEPPKVALIRRRYREAGLDEWDNAKVNSLCQTVGCTPRVLAAAAGEFRSHMVASYFRRNKWPVFLTLHFRTIQAQVEWLKFKRSVAPGPDHVVMAQMLGSIHA